MGLLAGVFVTFHTYFVLRITLSHQDVRCAHIFLAVHFFRKGNLLKICTLQMIFNIKTLSYYVEWVIILPSHKVSI